MSQDSVLKNKWLPLAIALAFAGAAHAADEKPKMNYTPSQVGAPAVSLTPPGAAPASALAQPAPAKVEAPKAEAAKAEAAKAETAPEAKPVEHPKKVVVRHVARHAAARKPSVEKVADSGSKDVTYSPQAQNEITVSDRDLNDFIFPSPIANGPVLPKGVPLVGKPIYMSNNTHVMVQFEKGFDKAIQMIVETEDGKVHKLYLKPRAVPGVTFRVDNARDARPETAATAKPADGATSGQPGARAEDIELLKRVVRGDIPAEFESVALPKPTRFDKFTVVPLAGWTDGSSKKVMVFSLVAAPGQTAVVAPPQFYRQGINAVLLTGDHVSENTTPQLFVVEELSNE